MNPAPAKDPLRLRVLAAPYWFVAAVISTPIALLTLTVLRGRCPNCHRRGLVGKRCSDPRMYDGRPFGFSECGYCHHQFHSFADRAVIDIDPSDPRYLRAS